jgi:hypothetical protein
MKFADDRPYADPETAARKLLDIARMEIAESGPLHAYVDTTNAAFLRAGGSVAEYATMLSPCAGSNSNRSQTRIELLPDSGGLFFYRRLKFSVFASRIRLGRRLHTVLNRDSSQHNWVSDSI